MLMHTVAKTIELMSILTTNEPLKIMAEARYPQRKKLLARQRYLGSAVLADRLAEVIMFHDSVQNRGRATTRIGSATRKDTGFLTGVIRVKGVDRQSWDSGSQFDAMVYVGPQGVKSCYQAVNVNAGGYLEDDVWDLGFDGATELPNSHDMAELVGLAPEWHERRQRHLDRILNHDRLPDVPLRTQFQSLVVYDDGRLQALNERLAIQSANLTGLQGGETV